jgi:hypothetical protein
MTSTVPDFVYGVDGVLRIARPAIKAETAPARQLINHLYVPQL